MTQKTRNYSSWRAEKLSDPERAARYLNAALNESREAFFHALTNVIQAHQVSTIAKKAGVTRESLYRSFSATGNPKLDTLESVLNALDLKISGIESRSAKAVPSEPSDTSKPAEITGRRKRRGRQRRVNNSQHQQLSLPFLDVAYVASAGVHGAAIEQRSNVGYYSRAVNVEVMLLPGFMLQQQQGGATAQPSLQQKGLMENEKKPVEFRRDPEDFATRYANNAHFEATIWDLKLTFGQTDATLGPNVIVQHTAVTVPWSYAKIFLYLLQANIAAQEAENGHIEVPANILVAPPKTPSQEMLDGAKHPKEGVAAVLKVWEEFVAANPELK